MIAVYGGLEQAGAVQWLIAGSINAALVAYLALFPGLFAVIVRWAAARWGAVALLTAPLVWVATEMGRTYIFTGFPWVLLGYSQTSVLPIAQWASVFGVYGVSALVVSVSAGLAMALQSVVAPVSPRASFRRDDATAGSPVPPRAAFWRFAPAVAPLVVVAAVAFWGSIRLQQSALTREGESVRVGLIQGNVDQGEKWKPARADAIFDQYLRMTEEAIRAGAQVVLWPEASMPFFFEEESAKTDRVRAIAKQAGVPILVGSDQLERGPQPRFYNAAFVVGPKGETAGVYRKVHLVPFGEYVPLKDLLFFAAPLVENVGPFSAGTELALLPFGTHRVSTAICYEIVYPNLVRRFIANGSELLTTITNDAWFGRTSAPYQHFEQASMRAIENGRYLVRAANTGISGVVDPYGRIVTTSQLFEPAVIVSDVRFLQSTTFYTRHGDVFAYASIVVTFALVVVKPRARRKMSQKSEI